MKISASQFRDVITERCQRHHMLDYTDDLVARDWPAFSHLDEEGQQAFLVVVLGTSPNADAGADAHTSSTGDRVLDSSWYRYHQRDEK
jgi:hypothetical protein